MKALEAAIRWLSEGVATIPIVSGGKTPAINSWKPYERRLPNKDELRLWFSNGYSLAVITGWRNLVVVDWDDMDKHTKWLDELTPAQAHLVLSTYQVKTGRGLHLYFRTATETNTMPGNGVDVKANGGYVLAPPSIHPSGRHYQAVGSIEDIKAIDNIDDLLPPPPTPSWGVWGVHEQDPFDAAMSKSPDFSGVEIIHSRWQVDDLLPGLPQHRGTRKTKCPFHDDGQASLAVYSDGHLFCFGCGWHARDVIGLYAGLHKMDIGEAIREMEAR